MSNYCEQAVFDISKPIVTHVGYMGIGALGALALSAASDDFDFIDSKLAFGYGAIYGLVTPLITTLSNQVCGESRSLLGSIIKYALEMFARIMIPVLCIKALGFNIGYQLAIEVEVVHKLPVFVDKIGACMNLAIMWSEG